MSEMHSLSKPAYLYHNNNEEEFQSCIDSRVYVLGPPTVDRKLVCAALASKMNLVYMTQESLKPETSSEQKVEEKN
ncbi:hypothetical protein CEXT_529701 [Caerostris extrusa]|uniref:Uncharacterized protein n=1 Tax=Caerostris extrusa TaxID=172846 RepID=A0AAV4Y8B7_CAEEX|nr:hypothetical protein CEXT_529701 [Caerostris extrusa]